MGKVERIDFLLVAFKGVTDAFAGNIPYLENRRYGCQSRGWDMATEAYPN